MSGLELVHPVEANELFVAMPEPLIEGLHRAGFAFHRWSAAAEAGPPVVRLVTGFATTEADVDALLQAAGSIAG